MRDYERFQPAVADCRQAVSRLVAEAQELETRLGAVAGAASKPHADAVRVQTVLLDEAYSKYRHIIGTLFEVAEWNDQH